MKTTLAIIALFVSSMSFSQSTDLKEFFKKNYTFFDSYTFDKIYTLKENLKTTVPFKIYETSNSGIISFAPQDLNKSIYFQDFSKYYLKDELRKVMLEIPGLHRPIDHDPRK
ncbi:hypothetical protein [Oceanihabitans sediminis]|uniref:hypothetical protein n=1 Tax=Oceanihabitans sediminis TaxID=1812012 RepID=UPI000930859E|nr:hypothetical protein [Oceanihabitans sediminis]MDX1277969.1 hypothetical protein [Oceanihabitans sediminis]MDX1774122.1 hypothetical protein [Oceanihabitans sediminis]